MGREYKDDKDYLYNQYTEEANRSLEMLGIVLIWGIIVVCCIIGYMFWSW